MLSWGVMSAATASTIEFDNPVKEVLGERKDGEGGENGESGEGEALPETVINAEKRTVTPRDGSKWNVTGMGGHDDQTYAAMENEVCEIAPSARSRLLWLAARCAAAAVAGRFRATLTGSDWVPAVP